MNQHILLKVCVCNNDLRFSAFDKFISMLIAGSPPPTHSDPPVPTVDLSNIPDDGTLGE